MRERNSAIELLRIISMMGVVALHYLGQGGMDAFNAYPQFTWFFYSGVRSIAVPLVNVFVLITGYFLVSSRHYTYRKPIRLLLIVFYYGITVYLLSSFIQGNALTVKGFIQSLFPFFFGSSWFIKTYLILYLLAPFINKALTVLSMKWYRALLLIQILLFSVWYSIGLNAPITDDGYGIINFITLYMIGGYIRRFSDTCRLLKWFSGLKALFGYCACIAITALASYFINPFGYAFITNVIGASLLFLFVTKLKPRKSRVINALAGNAFDVFYVHPHIYTLLGIPLIAGSAWMIPHLLLTTICCYLAGCASGWVREWIFRFSVDKLLARIPAINREIDV